jgi:tetratricopeptide (TPR) repeat protein
MDVNPFPSCCSLRVMVTVLLLCGTWQAKAMDSHSIWLNRQFETARRAEKGGHYLDAIKCYERILQRDPNMPEVYNNLGLDYYHLKRYEKAIVTLQHGLKLDPTMVGSRLFIGFAEFNLGSFKNSEEVLSAVVRSSPRNRGARLIMIRDQTALGQFDFDFNRQTLDMFPKDAELNYTLGTASLERIRQIANYANGLGVQSPLFQWIAVRTDTEKGDDSDARKLRLRLEKEGSSSPPPLIQGYDRITLLAQRCFQTVLELAPNSTFGHDVQGQVDEAKGLVNQALLEYHEAADHFAAGRLLAQNVRLPEAARELEEAVAMTPDNKLAVALLAKVYVQEHRPANAVPLLRNLLKSFPHDAYAWRDLGRAQLDLGQTTQAVQSLRTALRFNPSFSNVHYELAMAYRALGEASLEKEEIEKFKAGDSK